MSALKRYFFDTSAFLAVVKNEDNKPRVLALIAGLKAPQLVTSGLVAYELYRGVSPKSKTRKAQIKNLELMLKRFSLRPVYEAHAMQGAKNYHLSAGDIDPLLAAQCVDGGFIMVTFNQNDFEGVKNIEIHEY